MRETNAILDDASSPGETVRAGLNEEAFPSDEVASADKFVRSAKQDRGDGQGSFSLVSAFRCAARGIAYTFTSQRNLKIQSLFALAAIILGFAFRITKAEWLAILLCIMLVCSLEVVNTALESVVDLVTSQWHELARNAKDAGAGAVFLSSLGSIVVAIFIFVPHLLELLRQ